MIWHDEEIDSLNSKYSNFKILKGIESDILSEGQLDYPDEILASFDFIVASIHQGFSNDEDKMTKRLIAAIENKYTSILGHPTGRLLLERPAYPINHRKVIDACAANSVAIEINANPYRLDLDWRWLEYAYSKGVWISINPDAHEIPGFADMYYGVKMARKAGWPTEMTLNTLEVNSLLYWFNNRELPK